MATLGISQGQCNQATPIREKQVASVLVDLENRTKRLYEKISLLTERLAPITFDSQITDKVATEPPKQQVCPMAFTIRESVETLDNILSTVYYLIENLEI